MEMGCFVMRIHSLPLGEGARLNVSVSLGNLSCSVVNVFPPQSHRELLRYREPQAYFFIPCSST